MAEGNWVKPGTEPWPPPGEQYPGSSGGGMEAGSGENGRNMGYMGTRPGGPAATFFCAPSAAVTNISLAVILKTERWLP